MVRDAIDRMRLERRLAFLFWMAVLVLALLVRLVAGWADGRAHIASEPRHRVPAAAAKGFAP